MGAPVQQNSVSSFSQDHHYVCWICAEKLFLILFLCTEHSHFIYHPNWHLFVFQTLCNQSVQGIVFCALLETIRPISIWIEKTCNTSSGQKFRKTPGIPRESPLIMWPLWHSVSHDCLDFSNLNLNFWIKLLICFNKIINLFKQISHLFKQIDKLVTSLRQDTIFYK